MTQTPECRDTLREMPAFLRGVDPSDAPSMRLALEIAARNFESAISALAERDAEVERLRKALAERDARLGAAGEILGRWLHEEDCSRGIGCDRLEFGPCGRHGDRGCPECACGLGDLQAALAPDAGKGPKP